MNISNHYINENERVKSDSDLLDSTLTRIGVSGSWDNGITSKMEGYFKFHPVH